MDKYQQDFNFWKNGGFDACRIILPDCEGFIRPEFRSEKGVSLAMDAQPQLVTTSSTGIPAFLQTFIDPNTLRIVTAKNAAAEIFGEEAKGSITDKTAIFPVVEHTGEVSSYGDYNNNGRAGLNTNFPQREAYLYQTIGNWGYLEMQQAGLAKIQWASEVKEAGIVVLNKFGNLTYFLGVQGLQNYGLLNDPGLPPYIAPAPKAAGGLAWFNGNAPNATASEVFSDVVALFVQVVTQTSGNVDADTPFVLAMSPKSSAALNFTNSFNVNVYDQLKKNYKNMTVKTAVQYGALTAQNPQGSAAGEIVQLIAPQVEGQKTGFCSFNVKLMAGPVIPGLSSFAQKMTQGTWGAVVKQPFAISQMIGVG